MVEFERVCTVADILSQYIVPETWTLGYNSSSTTDSGAPEPVFFQSKVLRGTHPFLPGSNLPRVCFHHVMQAEAYKIVGN